MSEQKSSNRDGKRNVVGKTRKGQLQKVMMANEEIEAARAKRKARDEQFVPTVSELFKKK
ncbi:MAG: hypothetical protein WC878_03095 [Candidatus Paceibacterota bacterium]|jgi:hypothetical protein